LASVLLAYQNDHAELGGDISKGSNIGYVIKISSSLSKPIHCLHVRHTVKIPMPLAIYTVQNDLLVIFPIVKLAEGGL